VEGRPRFIGNVVRKTGKPGFVRIEYKKAQQARELGEQSGLFVVPRVVSYDPVAGILDFERLTGLKTLEILLQEGDGRLIDLLRKAGCALAVVHKKLHLPQDMKRRLPGEWMTNDEVFLHGDFTLANVCLQESTERLVIVDWSAARILEEAATVGPVDFDILWFLYDLFQSMPMRRTFFFGGGDLVDAFWRGYVSGYEKGVNRESFEYSRLQMTPFLRKAVLFRMQFRPWYKKGAFLARQRWAYRRWRSFKPVMVGDR